MANLYVGNLSLDVTDEGLNRRVTMNLDQCSTGEDGSDAEERLESAQFFCMPLFENLG
jgi:hypothetical protein